MQAQNSNPLVGLPARKHALTLVEDPAIVRAHE